MSPSGFFALALVALATAAGLALALWGLRRAAALLPLGRSRRALVRRALPLLELLLVVAGAAAVASRALGQGTALALVPAGAIAVLLGAGWFAVRDIVTGAILRAEDAYEAGQWIRVAGVQGSIRTVGARSLEIETDDGGRARIPYSRVARALLTRSGRAAEPRAHTFTLGVPRSLPPLEAAAAIRRAALHSFYASPARDPGVRLRAEAGDAYTFEVTVYAPDPEFFPEVESAVRREVASAAGPGAPAAARARTMLG